MRRMIDDEKLKEILKILEASPDEKIIIIDGGNAMTTDYGTIVKKQ